MLLTVCKQSRLSSSPGWNEIISIPRLTRIISQSLLPCSIAYWFRLTRLLSHGAALINLPNAPHLWARILGPWDFTLSQRTFTVIFLLIDCKESCLTKTMKNWRHFQGEKIDESLGGKCNSVDSDHYWTLSLLPEDKETSRCDLSSLYDGKKWLQGCPKITEWFSDNTTSKPGSNSETDWEVHHKSLNWILLWASI